MANKTSKGSKGSTATAAATPAQGGMVFQKLPKDFQIPTISKSSPWEDTVKALQECKGEAVIVLRLPYDKARKAYTKAKQLSVRAKAMGVNVETAVRKISTDPLSGEPLAQAEAAIFAGVDLPAEE